MSGLEPTSLEDFKSRLPLVDIVGRYVRLTRRGREHLGLCPFHSEKTPSFTVSDAKGFYHCFGCGQHGNAIDFVMAVEGLDFPDALLRLSDLTGIPAPRRSGSAPGPDRSLLAACDAAVRWFQGQLQTPGGASARDYLDRRGVDARSLERFSLGYAPDTRGALQHALSAEGFEPNQLVDAGLVARSEEDGSIYDRFRHRLMFPIRDGRGRTIAFGGRALGEARAKYLNSPETSLFHKSEVLYGLDLAREAARQSGTVIVAEGYLDVIALARAGYENAVAPLGTAISETQLRLLWKLAETPLICLDGDEAGLRAAHRLIERALPLLVPGKSLRFALLPPGEDPDSLLRRGGRKALAPCLEHSQHFFDFLWARETRGHSATSPERQAALDRRFRDLAGSIPDRDLKRRFLDAAFRRLRADRVPARAGTRRAQQGPRGGGGPRWSAAESVGAARLAAGVAGSDAASERDLVTPVLHYPALLTDIEEPFAALEFGDPELDALRQHILAWYGQAARLDADGLRAHLQEAGLAAVIERLDGWGAWCNWYGSSEVSLEEVRDGWNARHSAWARAHSRRRLSAAIASAIQDAWGPDTGERQIKAGITAVDRLLNVRDSNS